MRLLFFDFNINFGGGPQGSVYLAQRLNQENEVHIIDVYGACLPYCDAIKGLEIPLHVLFPGARKVCIGKNDKPIARLVEAVKQIPMFFQIRKYLIKKIIEINPDAIWVGNEKSLLFLTSSFCLRKYPIALYYRGWFTQEQAKLLFCWLLRKRVTAIMAHAKATIHEFKLRGFPEKKMFYAPNVIDIERTKKDGQNELDVILPERGKTPKILLPAARLEIQKGHLTAIKALSLLKKEGYEPVLWLPGKIGTGVSNVFKKELESKIEQAKLKENIFFVGWCENMSAMINASDIIILPSHTEGFPRIVLESMLLKRPVCATPVGGITEAIEHGKTGLLFPIDDAKALADCIKKLHLEPQIRDTIVENSYDLLINEFKSEVHTKIANEMFSQIVNNYT